MENTEKDNLVEISLVICTKNRAEQLQDCFDAVIKLTPSMHWELVIVDNASTDHTNQVIDKFIETSGINVKKVFEATPGTGAAKNAGWQQAEGSIIAFIDDDCYPDQDFLIEIVNGFHDPELGFLGGRVLLFDPTDYPITIQTSTVPKRYPQRGFIRPGEIHGANFAFRKTALVSVNGFDPILGAGTPYPCEDVDILARMLSKGWEGMYNPAPVIYHHHRRKTEAQALALAKTYDKGRGAYYAKCIINPVLRKGYTYHWLKQIRSQSVASSTREIWAALCFFLRHRKRSRI